MGCESIIRKWLEDHWLRFLHLRSRLRSRRMFAFAPMPTGISNNKDLDSEVVAVTLRPASTPMPSIGLATRPRGTFALPHLGCLANQVHLKDSWCLSKAAKPNCQSGSRRMKAVLCKTFGPAGCLVLEDIPPVELGPGQVAVAVKACGINFPDTLIIQGKYQFKPELPFAPGGEVAGVVTRVGPGEKGWQPGDEVIVFTTWGGLAQEMAVDGNRLIRKPSSMGFVEAAGFSMTYGTALYALEDRGALRQGETLLVLGAAGGIGVAGLQIGKALGARVIAGVSTPEKADFCRALGVDETIDYTAPGMKDRLKEMTDGKGVNVILDPVGGPYTESALRGIAWDGRLLVVGFAAGDIPKIPTNLTLLKNCAVIGVFWGAFLMRPSPQRDRHLERLVELHQSGAVKPQISAVYPLEQAPRAIQELADRRATGKVVVEVR